MNDQPSDNQTPDALVLPLRWTPDVEDDLFLWAGKITAGNVYRTGAEWRANGLFLTSHRSRGHKTREEAMSALLASIMELANV